MDPVIDTVRSTHFDGVIICHYPGCARMTDRGVQLTPGMIVRLQEAPNVDT